jgi:hypothetical protein
MENYIIDYVGRDIRQLFPILNIHNFRRFLTLLAQFSGHQLNLTSFFLQLTPQRQHSLALQLS